MARDVELALALLAADQRGLFTEEQAAAAGLSQTVLRSRGRTGVLSQRQPGVWQATTAPVDAETAELAALLAAGPLAMLSHQSAGARWPMGLDRPEHPWITLPFRSRLPALEGVEVVRSRHLEGVRLLRGGVAVTAPARTWVDLGRVLDRESLESALASAMQRKLIRVPEVDAVFAVAHHRAGTGLARDVLQHFTPQWESVLSARLGRLMEQASLGLVAGHVLRDDEGEPIAVLDFADVRARVAVEADGWAFHGSKSQQQADHQRDRLLLTLGWVTLRFTTADIMLRPEQVVAEIRAVLLTLLRAQAA